MLMWVDYALLGLILVSALVSLVRGFVREAMALVGWVAAVWIVVTFTEPVAALFAAHLSAPSVRLAVAAIVLFVGTLIVSGIIVHIVGLLVDKTGLSGTDRVLGVVFGAARGVIIVAIAVMLAGLTPLPRDPWWKASMLLPRFEEIAVRLRSLLPENLSRHIDFSPVQILPEAAPPARIGSGASAVAGSAQGARSKTLR